MNNTNLANLDDPRIYQQSDSENLLNTIHETPRLCEQAWKMSINFALPQDYANIDKVVILGMGASAIGGFLVSSLLESEAKLPIILHNNYNLPLFTDSKTLIIASSYSGMTEEVLSAFEQALATDAKKLVMTTGGTLKTLAEERKIPVFYFDYKAQPRAILPFSFLPILAFLHNLNFISDKSAEVAETVEVLKKLSKRINERAPLSRNPAKQLARSLYGHLPLIYGAGILSEAAHRWKTQFNENSKAWAFYEVLPELNHNAVVGYQFPAELASKIMVVMLRSTHIHKRVQLRYEITRQLLEKAKVSCQIIDGEGTGPLSQMMSLIMLGDYTTYYLAYLYKIDPSPVNSIVWLKEQLKHSKL